MHFRHGVEKFILDEKNTEIKFISVFVNYNILIDLIEFNGTYKTFWLL